MNSTESYEVRVTKDGHRRGHHEAARCETCPLCPLPVYGSDHKLASERDNEVERVLLDLIERYSVGDIAENLVKILSDRSQAEDDTWDELSGFAYRLMMAADIAEL